MIGKNMLKHPYFDLFGIAMAVVVVFGLSFIAGRNWDPPSTANDFFIVRDVHVDNTPFGMDPVMTVDRTIVQPFRGEWTAVVRPTDSFEYVCGNHGFAPYRPDATLPDNLRLFDFWLFDRGHPASLCRPEWYPLPRGCYVVDTTWDFIDPMSSQTLSVHVRSNTFCIE